MGKVQVNVLECTCKERGLSCATCGRGASITPENFCDKCGHRQNRPHRGDCPKSMKQIKKRRKKAKALKGKEDVTI